MRLVPRTKQDSAADTDLAVFWGIDTKYYNVADPTFSPRSLWIQEAFEVEGDMLELANCGPGEKAFQVVKKENKQ